MNAKLLVLLGSGFSIDEGMPSTSQINSAFLNLKSTDFPIEWKHLGGRNKGVMNHMQYLDRTIHGLFAEKFINFYVEKELGGNKQAFAYEQFFDYIQEFLRFGEHTEKIKFFHKNYFHELDNKAVHRSIQRLVQIINGVVANLLFCERHCENGYLKEFPNCFAFFSFISKLLVHNPVDVFSLNHDLFFESVASRHVNLALYYCDGFTEASSKYFGNLIINYPIKNSSIQKEYLVRLKYFDNKFDNKLRFYKLHGSINVFIVEGETQKIRVKSDLGIDSIFEEMSGGRARVIYQGFQTINPDFLTGVSDKIRRYDDSFYSNLFLKFENSLKTAKKLIVIGYGFQDLEINHYIERHFLLYRKKMLVIGKSEPEADLFKRHKNLITFINKGANGILHEDLFNYYRA